MEVSFFLSFTIVLMLSNYLDIEDMLKTIAFIKGHKWTTMMVKRAYFGNWLRDYSQAVDVGSLKGVNAPTIRILV
jgi:Heterokaryon incompatibility protein Het-C